MGSHPDHDTLATFRRRFLREVHANASRHHALSYGHIEKLEAQLQAEVRELLALAEQSDQVDVPDGVILPAEIRRRQNRLAAMAEAKRKIAARADERYRSEQAQYEEKVARRAAKEAERGRKLGGTPPRFVAPG